MADNDDDDSIPHVITFEIARVPDGVVIQLTYATSEERFDNRQWDTAVFGLHISLAKALAKALERETDPDKPGNPTPAKEKH